MYAQVILLSETNKSIDREFSYRIPEDLINEAKIGSKVYVQFGNKKNLSPAIIVGINEEIDIPKEKVKEIDSIDGQNIFISQKHIELARWMSEEYFCTLASCLKLMMPTKKSMTKSYVLNNPTSSDNHEIKNLTADQNKAIDFIEKELDKNFYDKPILLHGVTGSGKTEVYFRALEKNLAQGKQAIVLLPEIALTTQMINLFFERFGEKVGFTHSKLTEREKFIRWQNAVHNKISIMLGPRSAIFSPFQKLGLIIMDEEHESSYQSETTPKYNTRQVAEKICSLTDAKLILGSATPSIETYWRAQKNEIHLVAMPHRINNVIPDIKVIDMRQQLANGNKNIFSPELIDAIGDTLNKNQQVILFLNRRGHSTFVSCRKCGFVMKCSNCDVNYTFHSSNNNLICHYCGQNFPMPQICPACGSKYIRSFGIGTQKVETEIKKLFPDKNILRMDSDTVTKKSDYQKIINAFSSKKADILVGTQMIAKGFNFPDVSLVGIISADVSLNMSDFHSGENTFQLLTQVIGRAGRANTNASAFIQTYSPEHYSIQCAENNDYESFYRNEIMFRRQLNYPPFSNIFCIMLSSDDEKLLVQKINTLRKIMDHYNRNNRFQILGPAPAIISKIKNNYRHKILVKNNNVSDLKNFVLYCVGIMQSKKQFLNIKLNLSINPTFML